MRRLPPFARLLSVAALSTLALATAACFGGGADEEDEAAIEERLDETGTMDVVEWAAKAEYEAPEDGRLSEQQMEAYVAVQRRAARIREVARQRMEERTGEDEEGKKEIGFAAAMRAVGDLGDMMTAELRACRELDENPAEYQWVVEQIATARMAAVGNQARQSFAKASADMLEALEEQLAETDDAERQKRLREQIAEMREHLDDQEEATVSAAHAHNLELFERYREQIEAADRETRESLEGDR